MPPWRPEPGFGDFADSRRLSKEDVALIKAWVDAGMPEGDAKEAPKAPAYSGDWELGPPDLVLEVDSPTTVQASGTDLFRNFILPVPIKQTRWVRAMEIKPGSPRVVHHANVIIDRTASLRRKHAADWRDGVPGMDITVDSGEVFDPDSHFLFWKPDSLALVEPEGMPWRLDPGNDLILNMHLKPTGKVESVRARIGLYFTDKPATAHPMLLQLEHDGALDIPAGDADFLVEDQLKVPVDVDVLGVYPHAHYLGKKMEGYAVLPNGERRWLVLIKDWDIERQAVYRFAKPVFLPKGSVVHMRYSYDNSSANVRNPNSPPVRVRNGNRSVDEMGHLWLQVLPRAAAKAEQDPRLALQRVWMEDRLKKYPDDYTALYNLASVETNAGEFDGAVGLYRQALKQRPGEVRTMTALGSALEGKGDWKGAEEQYRAALKADPEYADARFDLAEVELRHEDYGAAEVELRRLLGANAEDVAALNALGSVLLATGRADEARGEFEAALRLDAGSFEALYNLGSIAADGGRLADAEQLLVTALQKKNDADAQQLLALVYVRSGRYADALKHLKEYQTLRPKDAEPHRALAQVYMQMGQMVDAIREQSVVVAMDAKGSDNPDDWNDLGVMHARNGDKAAARRDFERALAIDPNHAAARANLARL